MAVTFRRAPLVQPGERVLARQLIGLANADNDRLRSGLGNGTWRIRRWWYSLWRNLRNCAGDLCPSDYEWFSFLANVRPQDAQWPEAGPGEPEGANAASPIGAFVHGNEAAELPAEADRLTDPDSGGIPLSLGAALPSTPSEIWALGKMQRGAIAETGEAAYPAIAAGRAAYQISYSIHSPWGTSWGGYIASPLLGPTCDDPDPDDEIAPPLNWQIFFTSLKPELPDKVYDGTCQPVPGGEGYPTHIAELISTPWAYYVRLNNGILDVLSTRDYIEGPYTGPPALRRTQAGHIGRMLHAFAREFRGSDAQRAEPGYHVQHSFLFRDFLQTQYFLAPQRGSLAGEQVEAEYRRFVITGRQGRIAAGARSNSERWADGYVLTHVFVSATGLQGGVSLTIEADGRPVGTVSLTGDPQGRAEQIVHVRSHPTGAVIALQVPNEAVCASIEAEATELYPWLPEESDQYLVLRCTLGRDASWHDGVGTQEGASDEAWRSYVAHGCIINAAGQGGLFAPLADLNTNAVVDATRRLALQCLRCIPRQAIVDYEVVNGRSVLYCRRYADQTAGGQLVDLFAGIAPAADAVPSGGIRWGRSYVVRSGRVTYAEQEYTTGHSFTGLRGKADYAGDGAVFESEGIYHDAPPTGESNEWLVDVEGRTYWYADGSPYKTDVYADRVALVNRSLFGLDLVAKPGFRAQFNYGSRYSTRPEAPDAYNYDRGLNAAATEMDYRGSRIYETPGELDSVTVLIEGGVEIVRLAFTGRLYSTYGVTGGAPESIERGELDAAQIRAEPFRTPENTIREYLLLASTGQNCDSSSALGSRMKPGDRAVNTEPYWTDQMGGWDVFGACMPLLWLTRLVPKPHLDADGIPSPPDTRITHDVMTVLDVYLRAQCEGYIAGGLTKEIACAYVGSRQWFDYTWDRVCFEAFGAPWIGPLPDAVRPDQAEGHGPLPTLRTDAEVFNRYSRILNLLDKVRVMLPYKLQYRQDIFVDRRLVPGSAGADCAGGNTSCGASGKVAWYGTGAPSVTMVGPPGDWTDTDVIPTAQISVFFGGCHPDSPSDWALDTLRVVIDYRIDLVDPVALYACPELWRDMINTAGTLIGELTVTTDVLRSVPGDPSTCFGSTFGDCNFQSITQVSSECGPVVSGRLEPGQPGLSWHAWCNQPPIPGDFGSDGYVRSIDLVGYITDAFALTIPIV